MRPLARSNSAFCFFSILLLACCASAHAQGTAFTYQGHLQVNAASVTGVYDFRFRLMTASTGGTQVATTITQTIQVTSSLFSTTLDFGAGSFPGANRFLEVQVRNSGSAFTFNLLSPRQQLLPAPYAIDSGNANLLNGLASTAFLSSTPPISITASLTTGPVLSVTNSGASDTAPAIHGEHTQTTSTAPAILGETDSTAFGAIGMLGRVNPTAPGSFSVGVSGVNAGLGGTGIGVYGSQAGGGWGVYGQTPSGVGVHGDSTTGYGVYGSSTGGTGLYGISLSGPAVVAQIINSANANPALTVSNAGSGVGQQINQTNASSTSHALTISQAGTGGGARIQMANAASSAKGLEVINAGSGDGVYASSATGTGVEGVATSVLGAGVIGRNSFGEAVSGVSANSFSFVGAVTGENDGAGYGVYGLNTQAGVSVYGLGGSSSSTSIAGEFQNINASSGADVLQATGNGSGYSLDVSATGTGGRGILVATDPGQGNAALTISNGTLVLKQQNGYTSGGIVDKPMIVLTTAGPFTLPTSGATNGTTVWLINSTGSAVSITNALGGAVSIAANRAQQFIYDSTLDSIHWIATQ